MLSLRWYEAETSNWGVFAALAAVQCLPASIEVAGWVGNRQSLNAQQSEMCKLESCCLFKRYLSLRAIFLAVVDLVYLYSSNACVFAMTNDDDD